MGPRCAVVRRIGRSAQRSTLDGTLCARFLAGYLGELGYPGFHSLRLAAYLAMGPAAGDVAVASSADRHLYLHRRHPGGAVTDHGGGEQLSVWRAVCRLRRDHESAVG